MPYEIKKNGENYDVVNTESGEVRATHTPPDAEDKAKRQVKLLHEVESHPDWDKE